MTASDPLTSLGKGTVLLVFGAAWCTPFRLLEPVLERLKDVGDVRVVDIDAHPEVAETFRVVMLPTAVRVVGGKERSRLVGAFGEAKLRHLLR